MNKLTTSFAIAVSLSAGLALTGCGATTSSSSDSNTNSASPTKEAAQAPDLTGTWKQTNSASKDSYQEAEITGDVITINWVSNGGDTKSIYWVGTFTAPTDASTPYVWTSTRDKEATKSALLSSQDDTKKLTFQDDTISYSASMLGTTTIMRLKKD
ncbi:hypothetical protein [Leifsonia tongyongensis]|nr:hypothetical protein [Diaminobutyricibacter tongyongensis]